MPIETLIQSFSTNHLVVLGIVVVLLVWLVLEMMVRYAVAFAVVGIAAYVFMMANYPKLVPFEWVGYLFTGGLGLFVLMALVYELVLWRRAKAMESIARQSRMRARYRTSPRLPWR